MKRQNYGDSYAQDEPEKELEDQEVEWEWDEGPVREKIRKKKGRTDDGYRSFRGRGGGKKKAYN